MPYKDPQKRKEYHAAYNKQWDIDNRERRREIARKHDKKRQYEPGRINQSNTAKNRNFHRLKLHVLEMYGGCCQYCGIDLYEVLCIDHMEDNGTEHRRTPEYRRYSNIFRMLAAEPYQPEKYQILCYNCNMAKARYGIYPGGKTYRSREEWQEYAAYRKGPTKGFSLQELEDL